MTILLNSPDPIAIERFVAAHPRAACAHRPAWVDVLNHGLGHTPLCLSAWRDGQVVGYLPLVETSSLIFGKHIVSLPYVNLSGVLADEPQVAVDLMEHAAQLGKQRGSKYVEIRNGDLTPLDGYSHVRSHKVRMTLPLPPSTDELWKTIPSKARNQVRSGQKHEMSVAFGGPELLDAFYHVFSINMRDLGTPVFPRQLFAAVLTHLGSDAELCVVSLGQRPIAGALLVHHRQTTQVPSASSLRAYNHTCANMLMYYHMLDRAVSRGSTLFDFGRSSLDSGPYKFKKQWGAVPSPTAWQQWSPRPIPIKPLSAEDERFGLAVACWKKLPVWVTRFAGPAIVRGIP